MGRTGLLLEHQPVETDILPDLPRIPIAPGQIRPLDLRVWLYGCWHLHIHGAPPTLRAVCRALGFAGNGSTSAAAARLVAAGWFGQHPSSRLYRPLGVPIPTLASTPHA